MLVLLVLILLSACFCSYSCIAIGSGLRICIGVRICICIGMWHCCGCAPHDLHVLLLILGWPFALVLCCCACCSVHCTVI